jgi:hypothetical protein
MMSLLGVLLGLVCLTVPCLTETNIDVKYKTHAIISTYHWSLSHCYDMTHYRYLVFAPLAFFVGVALAFVTPLGGIGMALGIVSLYSSIYHQMESSSLSFGPTISVFHWGAAFYIGILAAIVTLGSFVFPLGPGYSEMYRPWPHARSNLKERLFVWGRGDKPKGSV